MRTFVVLAWLGAALLPTAAATAQSAAEKSTAKQISSHIEQSGQLRNYRIGVTYQDGVAMLSGTVASAEQRDTALRLAEQVSGVSQVVCRLEYPDSEAQPRNLANAFAGQQVSANQGNEMGVVQAYGNNAPIFHAHAQRSPLLSRNASQGARRQPQMRRSNMPLPSPRPGMRGPIQQVSAQQGVMPAGGMCPPGYDGGMQACPPGGMAGGMGGPGGGMGGPGGGMGMGGVAPAGFVPHGGSPSYDNPQMPGYAWPSYASYPNYAALSYPQQYSPTAWPYIGPFYPYPQVPLAWRKVALEWDDGWWFLDFSAHNSSH
jgi:hypothetical protein